jgi:hypothetical protein
MNNTGWQRSNFLMMISQYFTQWDSPSVALHTSMTK